MLPKKPKRPKLIYLEDQPEMFEFPHSDGCMWVQYACGGTLFTDVLTAPLRCLDCGAPWNHFELVKDGPGIPEMVREGWKVPHLGG